MQALAHHPDRLGRSGNIPVVAAQGPKQEILTPPHHEYTELLLSSVPEMDTDWLDNLLAERERTGKVHSFIDG